jgi:hypothetical protein
VNCFYVLKVGGFEQYKYAWYEALEDARYADAGPVCPVCHGPVGGLYWLPPRRVELKQPRRVGDFVYGAGGTDLIVSERFHNASTGEGLTGIRNSYPVEVTRMGTTKRAKEYPVPSLFGIEIQHGPARVIHDEMGVVWSSKPGPEYCRACGPGIGGGSGIWRSIDRVVVDSSSWRGEDFFYALNRPGSILLSDRAREFIQRHGFTNASIIPCDQYTTSFDVDRALRAERTLQNAVYRA